MFGIVGSGEQAVDSRIPSLKVLEEEGLLRIAAVADPNTRNRNRAAERFGISGQYDWAEEMLAAEPDIGSIFNVTPHRLHAPTTLVCLEAGCHVLVEKPLATTVLDAEDMIRAAEEHEVVLCAGYQYPWQIPTTRRLLDEGAVGNVTRINAFWVRRDGIPKPDRGQKASEYWRDRETGGVGLDLGGHILSVIFYLLDDEPSMVTAQTWNEMGSGRYDDFRAEDTANWVLDWPNSRRAIVDLSWAANITESQRIGVGLWGDRGNLRVPLVGTSRDVDRFRAILYRRVHRGGGERVEPEMLDAPLPVDPDTFVAQARNFLEAAVANDPTQLLFPVEKALLIQRVFEAIQQSSLQGGVQVPIGPQ